MQDIAANFSRLKVFNSDNTYIISCSKIAQVTYEEKPQLKTISYPRI